MNEESYELASRWKRLGGSLLDSLISSIIIIPTMISMGVLKQMTQGQPMSIGQTVLFFILGHVVFLIINGMLLAKQGQTIGKMIVGTRIVSNHDRQILSLGRVFGLRCLPESLIYHIPLIGGIFSIVNALFIFRSDKRCIHDLIAGTIVVDVNLVLNESIEPIGPTRSAFRTQ